MDNLLISRLPLLSSTTLLILLHHILLFSFLFILFLHSFFFVLLLHVSFLLPPNLLFFLFIYMYSVLYNTLSACFTTYRWEMKNTTLYIFPSHKKVAWNSCRFWKPCSAEGGNSARIVYMSRVDHLYPAPPPLL